MSKAKLRADAINRFVVDAKAQGVYDSLKAACLLTGWDTLAGALTPLVGAAPTNNGFGADDYDRGGQGLKGNGSSKYLDSNRAHSTDAQDNRHIGVFASSKSAKNSELAGSLFGAGTGWTRVQNLGATSSSLFSYGVSSQYNTSATLSGNAGFVGASRSDGSSITSALSGTSQTTSQASQTPNAGNYQVFRAGGNISDNTLSWYSIGSSVDLAVLDTLVSRLMADLRAIEEDGMDRDALAYIRAVEAADGSYLETGVKQAIDQFVKGMKYDKDANGRSAWDALGACCIMAGARTISGALVPLKGPAPTAEGAWASGDYDRATGLKGDGSGLYLDTNRAGNADGQNDMHIAAYQTAAPVGASVLIGSLVTSPQSRTHLVVSGTGYYPRLNNSTEALSASSGGNTTGLFAASRSSSASYVARYGTSEDFQRNITSAAHQPQNVYVFAQNQDGSPDVFSPGRLAFYSIGSSLSLSNLDNRVSTLISSISTALS